MVVARGKLEMSQSCEIEVYKSLGVENELGSRFIKSMECWCGVRERDYPLAYWQVYVAYLAGEAIGVSGLYRRIETPPGIVWIGWLGVKAKFRGQGIGRELITHLMHEALEIGCQELWVFTEEKTANFYQRLGFEVLGQAGEIAPGQTHTPEDLVLKRVI